MLSIVGRTQDTLTIKEIEQYETELLNDRKSIETILSIGISINVITISKIDYLSKQSILFYTLFGLTMDGIAIVKYLNYKKKEKEINKIYLCQES